MFAPAPCLARALFFYIPCPASLLATHSPFFCLLAYSFSILLYPLSFLERPLTWYPFSLEVLTTVKFACDSRVDYLHLLTRAYFPPCGHIKAGVQNPASTDCSPWIKTRPSDCRSPTLLPRLLPPVQISSRRQAEIISHRLLYERLHTTQWISSTCSWVLEI
jgi:hypothetical protein